MKKKERDYSAVKCSYCKTHPTQRSERKEEHDTNIPLGEVRVYYCKWCNTYHAIIVTYEEIENE